MKKTSPKAPPQQVPAKLDFVCVLGPQRIEGFPPTVRSVIFQVKCQKSVKAERTILHVQKDGSVMFPSTSRIAFKFSTRLSEVEAEGLEPVGLTFILLDGVTEARLGSATINLAQWTTVEGTSDEVSIPVQLKKMSTEVHVLTGLQITWKRDAMNDRYEEEDRPSPEDSSDELMRQQQLLNGGEIDSARSSRGRGKWDSPHAHDQDQYFSSRVDEETASTPRASSQPLRSARMRKQGSISLLGRRLSRGSSLLSVEDGSLLGIGGGGERGMANFHQNSATNLLGGLPTGTLGVGGFLDENDLKTIQIQIAAMEKELQQERSRTLFHMRQAEDGAVELREIKQKLKVEVKARERAENRIVDLEKALQESQKSFFEKIGATSSSTTSSSSTEKKSVAKGFFSTLSSLVSSSPPPPLVDINETEKEVLRLKASLESAENELQARKADLEALIVERKNQQDEMIKLTMENQRLASELGKSRYTPHTQATTTAVMQML